MELYDIIYIGLKVLQLLESIKWTVKFLMEFYDKIYIGLKVL